VVTDSPEMVMEQPVAAGTPAESTTLSATFEIPAVVGKPVTSPPGDAFRPAGNPTAVQV
jgi:hypothetical protein